MSIEHEDFQRDEEMLERRRLKRLEMKRKRKMQQRIIMGVLAVALIFLIVLIARGCSSKKQPEVPADDVVQPPVQTPEPEVQSDPDTRATLAAVGDIMMYDSQLVDALQDDQTYDFKHFFEAISPFTISPDLTVGNLELNLLGSGPYVGNPKVDPYFNAPSSLAAELSSIGFDVLQTGNTYSIMNGTKGLQSTIDILNQNSIDHVGTHASNPDQSASGGVVLREINGIRIAFIGFTKGVNNMLLTTNKYAVDLLYVDYNSEYKNVDATGILKRVDAAKKLEPDVIVAMLHWGGEYELEISETQEEIRDLLFKNGVDVILGSHSHVVGPMEMREVETTDGEKKQCFVAYSLGNFISDMDKDYTMDSAILNLEFTKSGETGKTTISNVSYTPLYILDRGEGAEKRFEVLPIRNAIKSDMFQEYEEDMSAAIEHLKQNTKMADSDIDYDSGN